jgi:hypothetical protein
MKNLKIDITSKFVWEHFRKRFPFVYKIEYRKERGRFNLPLFSVVAYVKSSETFHMKRWLSIDMEAFLSNYFLINLRVYVDFDNPCVGVEDYPYGHEGEVDDWHE